MSERTDPPSDELYDANAEYYDLITRERSDTIADIVEQWVSRLPDNGDPLVDIGAGTGRITIRLARCIAPRDVIAVEPSRGLRAVLAGRIADHDDLIDRIDIIPATLDAARPLLPERLDGAIAFGVLPHFDPAARARLLEFLVERLGPGASALIEVMPPWTAEPVPTTPMGSFPTGRHRIDCTMSAEPVDRDGLVWTMTYRRQLDGTTLHEASGSSRCWVVDPETFALEAGRTGFDVAWPADDIAELTLRAG